MKTCVLFRFACLILLLLIQIPAWILNSAQNRFNWIYLLFLSSFIIPWEMCCFFSIHFFFWSVKNVLDLNMHLKVKKHSQLTLPFSLIYGKLKGFYKFAGCVMLLLQWRKRNRTMHFYSTCCEVKVRWRRRNMQNKKKTLKFFFGGWFTSWLICAYIHIKLLLSF